MQGFFCKALLLASLLCLSESLDTKCAPGRTIQGKLYPESGISQYTTEYANIPQRWDASNLIELPADNHEFEAKQRSQKCGQLVCVACGWKPPKMELSKPETSVEGAERCLYLSVFTPPRDAKSSELLPLVFHVHHGQMLYGFKTEMDEVKKVTQRGIAVSNANFRLGLFGFLPHPDLEQVNVGQRDLISALTWIQRYACQVGSDPSKVTLTGSSSGGAQIFMLTASALASGLFHNVWIHSISGIVNPGFFSQDTAQTFENSIKPMMSAVGCGTLKCMREMHDKRLLLDMKDVGSTLVRLNPKVFAKDPSKSPFAFDGLTIPNILEAGCMGSLANGHLPIVVGQSKDELDTLKFQFPLKTMIKGMLQSSTANTDLEKTERSECIQRRILNVQGVQETVEDMVFNLGAYVAGTKSLGGKSGPRWHFLLTAPTSATKRAWHTGAELLTWSPSMSEDSLQYDHLTKDFVLRHAGHELRHYSHENFLHFIRTGKPQDKSWSQTKESPSGEIGGLPSKLWSQKPLEGRPHWEQHHSNRTVQALHGLICKKKTVLADPVLDLKGCAENPPPPTSLDSLNELRSSLSQFKKSDLLFPIEMMKASAFKDSSSV